MNILTKAFNANLKVCVRYDPPNSIYEPYTKPVKTEDQIILAIHDCGYQLFNYIESPSDKVIMAYMDTNPDFECDILVNGSKELITYAIRHKYNLFESYANLYTMDEIMGLIKLQPMIIKYINNQTFDMCELAVRQDPFAIEFVDSMQSEYQKQLYSLAIGINPMIIKIIDGSYIDIKLGDELLDQDSNLFRYFPDRLHSDNNMIKKALGLNPLNIEFIGHDKQSQEMCNDVFARNYQSIKYIDKQYLTDDMIVAIKKQDVRLLKYFDSIDQDFCDDLIQKYPPYISCIPRANRTIELGIVAIKHDYRLLEHCEFITKQMMIDVFKSPGLIGIARKMRYDFILDYPDHLLIKIIGAMPNLLRVIPESRQTDQIVRCALGVDGYCVKYVVNMCDEYKSIAIARDPGASRYFK